MLPIRFAYFVAVFGHDYSRQADQEYSHVQNHSMRSSPHILVTGGAGFVGSHLVDRLIEDGSRVTVVDNFDPYYDPETKRANLEPHVRSGAVNLLEIDIRSMDSLADRVQGSFDAIVHMAAKAGVRPSIEDPRTYQEVNVTGTQNVLELARRLGVGHVVFTSSSSVYGKNPSVPWREDDGRLLPISPYAGSKLSAELLGHVYSHLYDIRFIALRLFTVYGPRQRPDLAIHKFARLMLEDRPIPVFGDGSTRRDYTYVGDIVTGILSALRYTDSRFEIFNIGNNETVSLADLIASLEAVLGKKAVIDRHPEQPGDVRQTWANIDKAAELLDYHPCTPLTEGLERFKQWLELR
jgi:UDP-glucuronate 4-epimerase